MKLNKSKVVFDRESHTYMLDGKYLQGITGMIGRQLFPDKYNGIPPQILSKAAERGTMVHEILELVDELKVKHESIEAKNYIALKKKFGLRHEASEYLVSDNEFFASCVDKVYREGENEFSLGDIKTTYKLDKEYVRWQLSDYAYMFEFQNPGAKVIRLFAIWLRGRNKDLVEVERIPKEIIIKLHECEISGKQFINPYKLPERKATLPLEYLQMEEQILEIIDQSSYWQEKKKELSGGIMKEMVKAGVYHWKGDSVQFIRKQDGIRKVFDKEAFEKDYPGVYEKYLKETTVAGSLTLKTN